VGGGGPGRRGRRRRARRLLAQLESIDVVYSQSWQYDDPAARLAERLGAVPGPPHYSGIGGSVPQVLAADVAAIRGATSTSP
jgi:hypothetical protein